MVSSALFSAAAPRVTRSMDAAVPTARLSEYVTAFGIESHARFAMIGTPGRSLSPVGVVPVAVFATTGWLGSALWEIGESDVGEEGERIGAEAGAEAGTGAGVTVLPNVVPAASGINPV